MIILLRIQGQNGSNSGYWHGTDSSAVKIAWYGNQNPEYARIHFLNLKNNPNGYQPNALPISTEWDPEGGVDVSSGKLLMSVNDETYLITFKEEENGNDYKVDTDLRLYNDTNVLLDVSRAWLVITDITDDGNHVTAKDHSGMDISYLMTWNKTQKRWDATEYQGTRTSLEVGDRNHQITIYRIGDYLEQVGVDVQEEIIKSGASSGRISVSNKMYFIRLKNKENGTNYFIDSNLRIYDSRGSDTPIDLSDGFEAKLTIKDTSGAVVKDASGRDISDVDVMYSGTEFPFPGQWKGGDESAVKIAWYGNENTYYAGINILNLENNTSQPEQKYKIEEVSKKISFNNSNANIDGRLDVDGKTTISDLFCYGNATFCNSLQPTGRILVDISGEKYFIRLKNEDDETNYFIDNTLKIYNQDGSHQNTHDGMKATLTIKNASNAIVKDASDRYINYTVTYSGSEFPFPGQWKGSDESAVKIAWYGNENPNYAGIHIMNFEYNLESQQPSAHLSPTTIQQVNY